MIVKTNNADLKLPDFLIVGAAKSGTTSLYHYLRQHPQVFMPRIKEPWFFSHMRFSGRFDNEWLIANTTTSLSEYLKSFKPAENSHVLGEASTSYLYSYAETIKNIEKVYLGQHAEVKIIILLRNPVERAWSHFMMNRRDGLEPLDDFMEAIKTQEANNRFRGDILHQNDYIGYGLYYNQVKAFLDNFKYVKVFLYEELCDDALKLTKDVYSFLNVSSSFEPIISERHNISGQVKSKLLNEFIVGSYPLKNILKRILPHKFRLKIKNKVFEKNIQRIELPEDFSKELRYTYFVNDMDNLQGLINRDISLWFT